MATSSEWLPYLASIFAPLVPVWIMGRAAAERPACRSKEALWWGWRDAVLPYIQGLRVPQDTLFIVCESDWCMAPEHESTLCKYIDDLAERYVWCPPPPPRSARPSDQPDVTPGAAASSSAGPVPARTQPQKRARQGKPRDPREETPEEGAQAPRRWQWWYPVRRRRACKSADGQEPPAVMLYDLVYFCNAASYHGVGDLVWLSYDRDRWGRKSTPGNGSTAIALTKAGAAQMSHYMILSDQPGHIDLKLGEALFTTEHDDLECVRILRDSASYAWNCFGGYHSHVSGCDKKAGYRLCSWRAPIQPYTRRVPERPARDCRFNRWLCKCRPTGTAFENKVAEIDPTREERHGFWLTHFEAELMTDGRPDACKCADAVLAEIQRRRPPPQPEHAPTTEV